MEHGCPRALEFIDPYFKRTVERIALQILVPNVRREDTCGPEFSHIPGSCGLRGDAGLCGASQAAGPVPVICGGSRSWRNADQLRTLLGRLRKHAVCLQLRTLLQTSKWQEWPHLTLVLNLNTSDREAWSKVFIVLENSVSAKYLRIQCVILISQTIGNH